MIEPILAHQLPAALDPFPSVEVLSLDCFDTLLWRNVHAPGDVFPDLKADSGITINQRGQGERRARVNAALYDQRNEVTIDEIYAEVIRNADEVTRQAAIDRELAAEARHCFPFAPTVALMKAAKAKGLKIVVVSDTYWSQEQLTELLRRAAGEDVVAMIDRIFCSAVYGRPKAAGLFDIVLAQLRVEASRVLHIGDNIRSDCHAAHGLGINTRHLVQFDEGTRERLRLETVAASMFNHEVRSKLPAYQPHRATLSCALPQLADPVTEVGYAAAGPILYAFARWVAAEAAELEASRGKPVHVLFLMRDGHLPKLVFDAINNGRFKSSSGEISRFTSTAVTFTDERTVLEFATHATANGYGPDHVLNRLNLPSAEAERITATLPSGPGQRGAFLEQIARPAIMARLTSRASAFRKRLVRHVQHRTKIAAGDTLMLVDLGYNGSVQNKITPVLTEDLGIYVAGRYLLLRESEVTGYDKRGMLDEPVLDDNALQALTLTVGLMEEICAASQGSVIDYKVSGESVRREYTIPPEQTRTRKAVQQACVQFARDVEASSHRRPASDDVAWSYAAAAVMTRLLFLPTPRELEVFAGFQHDVNLGTAQMVDLFDPEDARQQLKQQGPFYLKGSRRMFLPAEMRSHGLPLSLLIMASWRSSLDLERRDFTGDGIDIPVLVADGADVMQSTARALPTHDGYHVASIPVGAGQYAIGLQFPRVYSWLQVEAAWFAPLKALRKGKGQRIEARYMLEGIEEVTPGLMHCVDGAGFMMVPPVATDEPLTLHVLFRPLHARDAASVTQPATEASRQTA